MDVTGVFKRIVHELEVRPDPEGNSNGGGPDKNRILKPATRTVKDSFEVKAISIVDNISRLREFLAGNRDAYVDVVLNRDHSISGLSDLERDRIDAGANNFIRTINHLISTFKAELREAKHLKAQRTQHLEAVTDILEASLKSACRIYSEQKAIRVEKELQFQKLSRLEVNARSSKRLRSHESRDTPAESIAESKSDDVFEDGEEPSAVTQEEEEDKKPSKKFREWSDDEEEDYEMSPEEEQMFKRENERMYEDLVSLKDSVQQIESKVVRIAELQDIFTEKVLQQRDDIDLIASNATATTENVKDGNEELRKAIQRNASIRVYILFFLLVMSFSLLFLDWYNE